MSSRGSIPLNAIKPGTTLFVEGTSSDRIRTLSLLLLLAAKRSDVGMLLVATDISGDRLASWCTRARPELNTSNVKIVDCTGEGVDGSDADSGPDAENLPAAIEGIDAAADDFGLGTEHIAGDHVDGSKADSGVTIERVSSVSDLSSLGIKFSILHENLSNHGYDPVLTGFISTSTVLEEVGDVRTVFRFLMLASGRIKSADGLGVFPIDASAHDEVTVRTIREAFDGGIEIREADDGDLEFRTHGLPDQPEEWTPFAMPK
ncbi:hypothetical protein BRC81_01105 [Halobacteriales archaeon QS_1_68_20]|nr:MAG: hypothetical protein BRC81_01105 [Halobacteriales archaeon QS_1_68_20]